jgi:hypothetical protein
LTSGSAGEERLLWPLGHCGGQVVRECHKV